MRSYRQPSEFRGEILKLFEERPYVLIGQIAMLAHCSLDVAESYLTELEAEGLIRLMSPSEARSVGVRHAYVKAS